MVNDLGGHYSPGGCSDSATESRETAPPWRLEMGAMATAPGEAWAGKLEEQLKELQGLARAHGAHSLLINR